MFKQPRRMLQSACTSVLLITACGDTAPGPDADLGVEVVAAPASGTPGFLIEGIVLRVTDGAGVAREGVTVEFDVATGSVEPARVVSGADGLVSVSWRLGLIPGAQVLTARALSGSSTEVRIEARAFRVDAIDATFLRACGLVQAELWCWGGGQDFLRPTRVMAGRSATAMSVVGTDVCLIDGNGAVWCKSFFNQQPEAQVSGLPAMSSIASSGNQFCGIAVADRTPWCWVLAGAGQPRQVSSSLRLTRIAAGGAGGFGPFGCGIDEAGAAWCWGRGEEGQLGDGSSTSSDVPVAVAGGFRFQQIAAGGSQACGVVEGARVYCWGTQGFAALGRAPSDVPVDIGVSGVRVTLSQYGGIATVNAVATQWGGSVSQGFAGTQILQALPGLERLSFRDVSDDDSACGIGDDGTAWCSRDVFTYNDILYRGPEWLGVPEPTAP